MPLAASGAVAAFVAALPTALLAIVPTGEPTWTSLLLLGLLAGVLALDDTSLVQTWLSQPLPVGVLTGVFCGDPVTGLAIGLPVQLVLAGNLPVGQTFTGDPITALVSVVGAVVLSGQSAAPALRTVGSDQIAFVGWMVLAVGLLSSGGHFMIQLERRAFSLWMLEGHRTLRDGRLHRMERIHLRCLLTTFLRGFVTTVILLLVLLRFWIPAFAQLPQMVTAALAMLLLLLPGLGIGNLIDRYGLRTSWMWVASGATLSFVVTRYVL
jgi:mannose/fructose/N-acetylgalactosamine-specific phosphotransferase system component IIC